MALAAEAAARPPPDEGRQPLYADRVKVYPQRVSGLFRRIKWAVLIALLSIYYLVPWIRWNRGPGAPDQAVLVDMPGRRAYFFFIEIWPQEVYYLAGLLILGAVGLFLATSLLGRVWCGFTCPQTVWTDLFMWVERWIEGDRNKRLKLDAAPLSAAKAGKKVAKHAVWLVIALLTGGAWIMYFNDAPTVVRSIVTGQASATVYGFVGLFTGTTYLLAGWAREQVCIYMCPWPRFQSAMFDEHSLVVTYEAWRGEPRANAKAGTSPEGRGHCIDCGLCVRVCPTGIDIRDGQQLDCIGCGLCVDACNGVMAKMGWPRELITYDSLANMNARARGERPRYRFVRGRTIIYAALVVIVTAIMAVSLATRSTAGLNVLQVRAPLFVRLSDGSIRNGYTLKIANKERAVKTLRLTVSGLSGAELSVIGRQRAADGSITVAVPPDSVGTFNAFVRMPAHLAAENEETEAEDSEHFKFQATDVTTGEVASHEAVFSAPAR